MPDFFVFELEIYSLLSVKLPKYDSIGDLANYHTRLLLYYKKFMYKILSALNLCF